jgi:hypothetical protein
MIDRLPAAIDFTTTYCCGITAMAGEKFFRAALLWKLG